MAKAPKKFIDEAGLEYFASQYPTNATLGAVIDAIGEELQNYATHKDIPIDISDLTDDNDLISNKKIFLVNVTLTSLIGGFSDKRSDEIYIAIQNNLLPVVKIQYFNNTMMASLLRVLNDDADGIFAYFIYEDQSKQTMPYTILRIFGNTVTLEIADDYWAKQNEIPTDISSLTDVNNLLFSKDYNDLINTPEDKIFPITISLTSTTNGISDKSHTEISMAVNAGKIPFVYITYGDIKMVAPLARIEENYSVFVYEDQTVPDHMNYANLRITGNTATIIWRDQYITASDIPTNISAFTNDIGYLTEHQDLTNYAPKASPALTGTPTAPTAAVGTNTTQIATTAFVQASLPIIDTTITQNSTNAISSGAVYAALGDIETLLEAL